MRVNSQFAVEPKQTIYLTFIVADDSQVYERCPLSGLIAFLRSANSKTAALLNGCQLID